MKKQDYTKIEEEFNALWENKLWDKCPVPKTSVGEGHPARQIKQFIIKHLEKEYERGYKQAEMDEVFRDELL